MWANHPHIEESSHDVCIRLGLPTEINGEKVNTCAIRLSDMFNRLKFPVTPQNYKDLGNYEGRQPWKGKKTKKYYIPAANEMIRWLHRQFSKPTRLFGPYSTLAKYEAAKPSLMRYVADKQGIVGISSLGMKDHTGEAYKKGKTGHVDIFDGFDMSASEEWYPGKYIYIWVLANKPPPPIVPPIEDEIPDVEETPGEKENTPDEESPEETPEEKPRCPYEGRPEAKLEGNKGEEIRVIPMPAELWRVDKDDPKNQDEMITIKMACAFLKMREAAKPEVDLLIRGAFRTPARQGDMWKAQKCAYDPERKLDVCQKGPFVRRAHESTHGLGKAVDIWVGCEICKTDCDEHWTPKKECETDEAVWLKQHADEFGFTHPITGSTTHFELEDEDEEEELPEPELPKKPELPPAVVPRVYTHGYGPHGTKGYTGDHAHRMHIRKN